MNSSEFAEYIIDLLSKYRHVKLRRMFGGYGLYFDEIIFAIIINDELYFKTDGDLAQEYELAKSFPFTYQKNDKTVALSYWYVPAEVIESEDLLKNWFDKSLVVAMVNKDKKRKK